MKKLSFGQLLLILAASVNLSRWIGIYTISPTAPNWVNDILPYLDALSGLLTGLSIAGGLVFVAYRLGRLQPFLERKVRGKDEYRSKINIPFWAAALSAVLILILSAFLLPPYIRMSVPDTLRAEISNLQIWSIMAVLVGDLVIVAIAMADSKAAEFSQSKPQSELSDTSKPQANRKAIEKQPGKVPCEWCGKPLANSQNARNAHASHCKVLQEASKL